MAETEIKAKRNWRSWLLAGSLVLNFLLIGGMIGLAAQNHGKTGQRGPAAIGALGPLSRALPEEQRKELRSAFRSNRGTLREGRQRVDASTQRVLDIISAEEFDRDALLAVAAERAGVLQEISRRSHEIYADVMSKMSHAERLEYVEKLKQHRSRKPKKKN